MTPSWRPAAPVPPPPWYGRTAGHKSTPSSRGTGAGGTPPGPDRSSRHWNARPSPVPTPPLQCCPTWPAGSSPRTPNGPVLLPRSRPWRVPPHVPGPDHTCPGSGPGHRRPCWPSPWARPPVTGAHLASYAGLTLMTRRSGSSIRGEARLPRRQQEA